MKLKRLAGIVLAIAGIVSRCSTQPAFATIETTTVTGKLVTTNGSGAPFTAGTVTATLSSSGTATDGASTSVVAGKVTATIASDGTISLVLVPNDAIVPANTYYIVKIAATAPYAATWTENWSVATSPDPVAIGLVSRVNTPPGIAAPVSRIQDEGMNLARRPALNFLGSGIACSDNAGLSRTDCVINGGGIPGGSTGQIQFNNGGAFGGGPAWDSTNSAMKESSSGYEVCYAATPLSGCGYTTPSSGRGIFFNRPTNVPGTIGLSFGRGGSESWQFSEDTTAGPISYFDLWGKYASFSPGGSPTVQSGDLMGISWAGADSAGLDGPAFTWNMGGFNVAGGELDAQFDYQFGMQTKRTSGTGRRNAWFKPAVLQPGVATGGIDVSPNGNIDAIRIFQILGSSIRATMTFGTLDSNNNYWRFGHDIPNAGTSTFGLFDAKRNRWTWYADANGIGILKSAPAYALDVNGTVQANAFQTVDPGNGNRGLVPMLCNTIDVGAPTAGGMQVYCKGASGSEYPYFRNATDGVIQGLTAKEYTVSTLPAPSSCNPCDFVVHSTFASGDCTTTTAGTSLAFCHSNGTAWHSIGDGGGSSGGTLAPGHGGDSYYARWDGDKLGDGKLRDWGDGILSLDANGHQALLDYSPVTADRIYSAQDKDCTVACIDDIPYPPTDTSTQGTARWSRSEDCTYTCLQAGKSCQGAVCIIGGGVTDCITANVTAPCSATEGHRLCECY